MYLAKRNRSAWEIFDDGVFGKSGIANAWTFILGIMIYGYYY